MSKTTKANANASKKVNTCKSTSNYKRGQPQLQILQYNQNSPSVAEEISSKITHFFSKLVNQPPSKTYNEKSFVPINRSFSNVKVQVPQNYENDEMKNQQILTLKNTKQYQSMAPNQERLSSNNKLNKLKSDLKNNKKNNRLKTQSHHTSKNLSYNLKYSENKENSLSRISKDVKRRLLFDSSAKQSPKSIQASQKNVYTQIKNIHNFSKTKTKTESDVYAHETRDSLSLKKLRLDMQRIKNMQNYQSKKNTPTNITQNKERKSQSRGKKGMTCTLYQKSIQKNQLLNSVYDSHIKSTSQKPHQDEIDLNSRFNSSSMEPSQFDSKVIKRIKLKKKEKQMQMSIQRHNHNPNATNNSKYSKNLNSSKTEKKNCFDSINISVVGKAPQTGCKLSKILKSKNQTQNQQFFTEQSVQLNPKIKEVSKTQEKFLVAMQKIKSYKFVSAYFSQLQLEGLLNQYQKAGEQECKWPLLVIDQVYQKIKHVDESKLKGIQHSRQYFYE